MIGLFNECFPPVMDGVSLTVSNLARCFYQQGREVVPGRHPYRYGFPSLDFKFQKQVAAQNFEILHAHCPFSSGDFALKTARRKGIPLVATFHSKYRDDFERVIPNKALVDYLVGKVVKFYESVDEVWVPQTSVGETLREYGYKGTFEVVDNGTEFADVPYTEEMKRAAKKELYVAVDEPLLLFVGLPARCLGSHPCCHALARHLLLPFSGDGHPDLAEMDC